MTESNDEKTMSLLDWLAERFEWEKSAHADAVKAAGYDCCGAYMVGGAMDAYSLCCGACMAGGAMDAYSLVIDKITELND